MYIENMIFLFNSKDIYTLFQQLLKLLLHFSFKSSLSYKVSDATEYASFITVIPP